MVTNMDRERVVNGKRVVFRTEYPVAEYHDVPYLWLMATMPDATLDAKTKALSRIVESWEFDGDPHDPAAWGELDTWREFWPIWANAVVVITDQLSAEKN